jgi:hypothetical protein
VSLPADAAACYIAFVRADVSRPEDPLSPGDRPTSPSISDGLFYWIAGICGFATGVVGAAFHLTVDALLRWPIWLIERLGRAQS